MSIFAVKTDLLIKSEAKVLFNFGKQKTFLTNMRILASSFSRMKCKMAYTNLKILNFYKPDFHELTALSSQKKYPTAHVKEKFKNFWNDIFVDEIECKGDRAAVEKRKNNVDKSSSFPFILCVFYEPIMKGQVGEIHLIKSPSCQVDLVSG